MSDITISVDLRASFGAARNQGSRPTCLAFAASDAHAALREGWVPLSCEYAFFQAQRHAGRMPSTGALLSSMLEALRKNGQPQESGWPYLSATPADPASWLPPREIGTLIDGALYCFGIGRFVRIKQHEDLVSQVAQMFSDQRRLIFATAIYCGSCL